MPEPEFIPMSSAGVMAAAQEAFVAAAAAIPPPFSQEQIDAITDPEIKGWLQDANAQAAQPLTGPLAEFLGELAKGILNEVATKYHQYIKVTVPIAVSTPQTPIDTENEVFDIEEKDRPPVE